jgi:hypothetical protein
MSSYVSIADAQTASRQVPGSTAVSREMARQLIATRDPNLAASMQPCSIDFVTRLAVGSVTSNGTVDVEVKWKQFPESVTSITPTFASFLNQNLPEDARREWDATIDDMIAQIKSRK